MNWDTVAGSWRQLKGMIKTQRGYLTTSQRHIAAGRREALAGRIQRSSGICRDEADKQMKRFEAEHKGRLLSPTRMTNPNVACLERTHTMIVYTRFIRPDMPPENLRNVPAYVAPLVDMAQRQECVLPTRKPKEAGPRLFICP